MQKVIAIDFDGTIVENDWPNVGPVIPGALEVIELLHLHGHKLILNTCRVDGTLKIAEDFLKAQDMHHCFLCVNVNDPELILHYGVDCRKISADIYIDDRAIGIPTKDGLVDWFSILRLMKQQHIIP